MGESSTMGRNPMATTTPVAPACPVFTVTWTPTATLAIHVPTLETSAPAHSAAKPR